jgi:hypothetical protein
MTRIEKKHTYQEQDHPVTNSIFGLMDGVMLKVFRINESELDKICQLATDEELELFTKEDRTIKESRQLLTFLKDKVYVKEPKY